jgi:ribonuclease P protein component
VTAPNDAPSPPEGPLRLTFPRDRRLRSGRDFERIYTLKQKAGDDVLLLFGANNELGRTRIGLSVSRRNGNSVQRHRLRRLLKEAYRLEQHHIPEGLDLILIPSRNAAAAPLEAFRESLVKLAGRLSRKLRSPPEGETDGQRPVSNPPE